MTAADKIQALPELLIMKDSFSWRGQRNKYDDIASIRFNAAATTHSVYGLPTGKTYEALLSVKFHSNETISITGTKRTFKQGLKKTTFEGIQLANAILSRASLAERLKPMEHELATKGFFSFSDHQISSSREVFKKGQLIAKLDDPDTEILKEAFSVLIRRRKKGLKAVIRGMMSNDDVVINLESDQDCFLFMLHKATGLTWKDSPPPEKPVDREGLFYRTVVRFGACLAMADRSADASELVQLKRYFKLGSETLPEAARLYNEVLHLQPSVEDILSEFAEEFADALELRESFLVVTCAPKTPPK